ncbi:unnamed protein product, partial [Meganyctiphanes norvegica]
MFMVKEHAQWLLLSSSEGNSRSIANTAHILRLLMLRLRRLRNNEAFNTLLMFLRYSPYVLMVIGLKIYVLTLLVNSNSITINDNQYEDYEQKQGNQVNQQQEQHSQLSSSSTTEDPLTLEKQVVLRQLNDTIIKPSFNNRTPDTIWLFFNRIPRTGGQTLVNLLKSLSEDLDFQHQEHVYRTPWQRLMTDEEQRNLATWFEYNFWPKSYDRFSLYINFTEHRSKYVSFRPAYMTLVRDPVEKFISNFRYKRTDPERTKSEMGFRERQKPGSGRKWYWKKLEECVMKEDPECDLSPGKEDFTSSIPFLCGQEKYCLETDNQYALQRAKFNAEYEYSVIGAIEHWNETLTVLETYLPLFFNGATQRYWDKEYSNRIMNKNPKKYKEVPAPVIQKLRNKLSLEYELYEFLIQKLHKQYTTVAKNLEHTTKILSISKDKVHFSNWDRMDIEFAS